MRANYGKVTREFFLKNTDIKQLIDFGDSPIFEAATTYTNILIFAKGPQHSEPLTWDINAIYNKDTELDKMLSRSNRSIPCFSNNAFIILPAELVRIKNKVESFGKPLKEWDVSINFGIKTGFNEAFIIDKEKKDELIAKEPKCAEIIKPILRGRDIKKYSASFADLWMINTHNGIKALGIKRINVIEEYPGIYDYLLHYKEKLQKRQDKGEHWTNLRNCAYINEFNKQKIMWAEIVYDSAFYLDDDSYYPEATVFFMTGKSLKYIIALLNSRLLTFAFKAFYAGGDLRGSTFRYKKAFLECLPLPDVSKERRIPFENLVTKISEITKDGAHLYDGKKKYEFLKLDAEIDARVAKLYDLTEDEYATVLKGTEDDFRITALNIHRDLLKGLRV
jgi:hypothetical protein